MSLSTPVFSTETVRLTTRAVSMLHTFPLAGTSLEEKTDADTLCAFIS